LNSIISGIIGGIISPFVLAFLQQYIIWQPQKRLELKQTAFDEAVQALAMYEADALDIEVQANKPSVEGLTPQTHFRPETKNQIQKALALVEAFFNQDTFSAFSSALSSGLSVASIPNVEHSKRRTKALQCMAKELELENPFASWMPKTVKSQKPT